MSAADALRMSAIRRSGHAYPGNLKCRLSHPASRDPDVKYPIKGSGHNSGWDIRTSQGGLSACIRCRDPSSSTPSGFPKRTCAAMLSGSTPSGFPKRIRAAMLSGTREHHTPDDSISYPDILSGSLTSAALQWCVRTPCSDIFAMDSKRTLLNIWLFWWSKSY